MDAVMDERDGTEVSTAIAQNERLQKAEMHLRAAFRSLKRSNKKLSEEIQNDAKQCH